LDDCNTLEFGFKLQFFSLSYIGQNESSPSSGILLFVV